MESVSKFAFKNTVISHITVVVQSSGLKFANFRLREIF